MDDKNAPAGRPEEEEKTPPRPAVPFQKNREIRTTADGHGKRASDCGDQMEFFITLEGETVGDVTCRVAGCTNTVASARAAGMLAKGKTVREALAAATPQNIEQLAGLPEQNRHCADMAAEAMKTALTDAVSSRREPWRRLYRKP